MNSVLYYLTAQVSSDFVQSALCFMRIALGILTIIHGFPKIMGGPTMWKELGTIIFPLGIRFLPTMWGFLGACTEFFGGISLVLGLGTRIACICLTFMMFVAFFWHFKKGDEFQVYSFPLTLMVVYFTFVLIGSGPYSLDYYFNKKMTTTITTGENNGSVPKY